METKGIIALCALIVIIVLLFGAGITWRLIQNTETNKDAEWMRSIQLQRNNYEQLLEVQEWRLRQGKEPQKIVCCAVQPMQKEITIYKKITERIIYTPTPGY